ncbi:MAG: PAS domain S-box protein [Spirochaetales bacterium]|nr:PAS domain S-box protein [Spirochaetales bacterium]
MELICRIFETNAHEPDDRRKRKILSILLAGTAGCCILFLGFLVLVHFFFPILFSAEELVRLGIIVAVAFILCAACFLLNRYVSGIASGVIFTFCLTVLIALSDAPIQLASGRSLLLFSLPIIIASVIIRPYAAYIVAFVSGLIISVFAVGLGRFPNIPSIVFFFLIAFICWISMRSFDMMVGELKDSTESAEKALTLQRQTLKELETSEERYSLFVENFKGITYRGEIDFTPVFFHGAVEEITGYTEDDFISGKVRWDELIQKDDLRRVYHTIKAVAEIPNYSCDREYRIIRKDGKTRWIHEYIQNTSDANGTPHSVLGLVYDISEQKRIDVALEESRKRFEAVFNSTLDAIFLVDDHARHIEVNPAACELTGYSKQELLSMTVWDTLMGGTKNEASENEWGRFHRMGSIRGERILIRKDGTTAEFEFNATSNILPGVHCAVLRDIRKRKKLEEQLNHSVKMEALGRLAGGIAHDFNNLLTTIFGYCDIAKIQFHLPKNVLEIFEEIRNSAAMAATLTKQLLAFSRKQIMMMQVFDLNELIRNINTMLGRIIGEDIELGIITAKEDLFLRADVSQIEQIVMNLAVNSRDAMPHGGKLIIETGAVHLDESYTELHADVKPGEYVVITVTDTGCGMDGETIKNIFEPFFTTKDREKGTGLGLATVFGIVRQSGGHINVYSEVGHGTTFKIFFPRQHGSERTDIQKETTGHDTAGGFETLLLVEDDESLRKVMRRTLSGFGYTVIDTHSGQEALSIIAERQLHVVNMLITDVILPEMNVTSLTERISAIFPEIKILYISGYTEHTIIDHGIRSGGVDFLQKPFSPEMLAKKVREILDRSPGDNATG